MRKNVHFGDEKINDLYGLMDEDMGRFEVKGYRLESSLDEKICPGREVSYATTKMWISLHDFTTEARIFMNII